MKLTKDAYIERIRSESLYKNLRFSAGFIAVLFYILAFLSILKGVSAGTSELAKEGLSNAAGLLTIASGLTHGLIWIILGKVSKGASLALADIADCLIDLNHKSERQPA